MAGCTQCEKASEGAWQGASDRTHTRVRHHLGGCLPWMRVYLKPALTFVALRQNSRSVTHHAAPMSCTVEMLELQRVKEQSGAGQQACQVAGHADDLQPSGGHGRLRHHEGAATSFSIHRNVCVRGLSLWLTYIPVFTTPHNMILIGAFGVRPLVCKI